MKFKMSRIVSGKREWKIKINGVEQEIGFIEFESDHYGKIIYGLRPEGYDSWVFYEPGGGGAAILPYARTPNGEILVALLQENRLNMGDNPVFDLIGGLINPGETHAIAQVREAEEETGLNTIKAKKLPGLPGCANRLYWVADAQADEGIHKWALEVPFTFLEQEDDGSYKFKADVEIDQKKAKNVRFFLWHEAVMRTPDELARAAIAQLLAMLI